MTKSKNITKKQHYIPQVYLRGFSPQYKKEEVSNDKYTIYCYNINSPKQIEKAIPVKSICRQNNLYEVTRHDGEIILPNHLENFFSKIEEHFSIYRKKLEQKAFINSNLKTNCFLTNEEKVFWATFIIIQILRLPQILKMAEDVSKDNWNSINDQQAKNIARMICLPFFKELDANSKETTLFCALFNPMKDMSFAVGVDKSKKIITSDNPVYICGHNFPYDEYDEIIFPITSEICLFLFGNEEKKKYRKNFLSPINDDTREKIIKAMSCKSDNRLYSNHILDAKDRKLIKENNTEV